MLKSFSRYLVISICLAGTLSLVACGGSSSDPSNQNNPTDDEQNQTDDDNQNNDQNDNDTGDNPGDDTGDDSNDDTGGDNNDDDQSGDNSGTCTPDTNFYGQIKGSPSDQDAHAGGKPSTEALTSSAGLQEVVDKLKSAQSDSSGDSNDGSDGESGNSNVSAQIDIEGAVVTATSFGDRGNDWFWLQDQDQVIQVYLPESHPTLKSGGSAVTIRVGMKLNFTATKLKNFNGTPEIVGIENFEVASEDNSVPYHDILGGDSSVSDASWGELVRVGGTLENRSWCTRDAGYRCYDLTMPNGETITLRSNRFVTTPSEEGSGDDSSSGDGSGDSSGDDSGSDSGSTAKAEGGYFPGTCVTVVAPLGQFPGGPLSTDVDDPEMQIQETNYAWTKEVGGSDSGSNGSGQ